MYANNPTALKGLKVASTKNYINDPQITDGHLDLEATPLPDMGVTKINSAVEIDAIDAIDSNECSDDVYTQELSSYFKSGEARKDINNFWESLMSAWSDIHQNLMELVAEPEMQKQIVELNVYPPEYLNLMDLVNSYLSEKLRKYVKIVFTVSQINLMAVQGYEKHVEMYFSPKLKKLNLAAVIRLLKLKPVGISNLSVAKYLPYHTNTEVYSDITYGDGDIVAKYDDFGYKASLGYNQKKMPCLNIVIMVKQPLASKILKKYNIKFTTELNTVAERGVWLADKCNPVDTFLLNILGEYNVLEHIGYIEILPEDDPLITEEVEFMELKCLKDDIKLVIRHHDYDYCNFCLHNEYEIDLTECSKCDDASYCSLKCRIADLPYHFELCKGFKKKPAK